MKELISFTDSFRLTLDAQSENGKKILKEMFFYYRNSYEKFCNNVNNEEIPSIIYSHLIKIDELINQYLEQSSKSSSCKKGCSYCCYQKVSISKHEAQLLIRVINEGDIKIDVAALILTAKMETEELPYDLRRCPLLGNDNLCQVYEYRPAVCRLLNVVSKPELCDTRNVNEVQRMIVAEAEALISGVWTAQKNNIGSIQKMLLEGINE